MHGNQDAQKEIQEHLKYESEPEVTVEEANQTTLTRVAKYQRTYHWFLRRIANIIQGIRKAK